MDEAVITQRLAHRIRRLRDAAGLTQEELGELVQLPMQRISEIERGKRNVQAYERGRIARALGTTERELFADLGYSGEAVAVTGGAHAGVALSGSVEVVRGN